MARDDTHGREGIRHGADFDALSEQLATLREIPVTRTVTNAALAAYRELAHRQPLLHRSVKLPDVPIAAAARKSAKLVKGSTLKVYAGAPHGLASTHQDQFNADLLAFIQG